MTTWAVEHKDSRGPSRKIVSVGDIVRLNGPQIFGDVRLVTLSCGHVGRFNATFTYRDGDTTPCFECGEQQVDDVFRQQA